MILENMVVKEEEVKRIPYLHYYYTDLWCKINLLPAIGHIAANHSTWDLELEDLPIESFNINLCRF